LVGDKGALEFRKIYLKLCMTFPGDMKFWLNESLAELNAWFEALNDLEGAEDSV